MSEDVYAPYRNMLAGKEVPIFADKPYPGRYRMKRGSRYVPVLINFNSDGELTALVDTEFVEPTAIWTYCAKAPVDKTAYAFCKEHGRWPDEPENITRSNMPSDPLEALLAEIEDKSAQADEYLTKNPEIKTQQTCDLFRNLQAQIIALHKRAEALFDAEKKPLLEATRACDDKYRFRGNLKVLSERLRSRYQTFLRLEEERQVKEAAEKYRAEQERVAKEKARIEAERAKLMQDDPIQALTSPAPELPLPPAPPEPPKVQAGGGVGRKAGLKTVWRSQITDYDAAFAHFAKHPDLRAELERLVQHLVRDSKGTAIIPGVTITAERVAA